MSRSNIKGLPELTAHFPTLMYAYSKHFPYIYIDLYFIGRNIYIFFPKYAAYDSYIITIKSLIFKAPLVSIKVVENFQFLTWDALSCENEQVENNFLDKLSFYVRHNSQCITHTHANIREIDYEAN